MKAIFKYHLLIVATLAGFLYTAGCSKAGEETPTQVPLEATLDGSPNFKWNSQGRFLSITTTADWTVTFSYPEGAPAGWCSVSPSTGEGNKNLWIATASNNTTVVREATIVVATATENVSIGIVQYSTDGEVLPVTLNNRLELPKVEDPDWLLHYTDGEFTLEYDTTKKHSKWVAWQLYKSHMGSSGRTDYWQFDPRIPPEYCPVHNTKPHDFTGYDRGHLCPSADRTQSVAMNRETFMYSNMSPQHAQLNQLIWEQLEEKERTWASGTDTLYICAGGTILKEDDIDHYSTPSAMAVPKYYFKVILRKKVSGAYDAIGFWFENKSYTGVKLSSAHTKSVDDIEALTGIDFFYQLPEAEQNRVEILRLPSAWGLN
jgi:endonuclease G